MVGMSNPSAVAVAVPTNKPINGPGNQVTGEIFGHSITIPKVNTPIPTAGKEACVNVEGNSVMAAVMLLAPGNPMKGLS